MNNYQDYQTDLGSYNNEIAGEFAKRDERTAAMRGQLERQKDERVNNLTDVGKDFESASREWLEGGLGGGIAANEIISGGKNVRKLYRAGKAGFNAAKNYISERRGRQMNIEDDDEAPGEPQPQGEATEEVDTPNNSGEVEMTTRQQPDVEMTTREQPTEEEPGLFEDEVQDPGESEFSTEPVEQSGNYGGDFEDTNSSPFTRADPQDAETNLRRVPDSDTTASPSDGAEDIAQGAEEEGTDLGADLGGEIASDSVLDFLGPVGWLVGGGLAIAGVAEEIINANKAHNASEQAANLRSQAVNVRAQPMNISGSYVAPSKSAIY